MDLDNNESLEQEEIASMLEAQLPGYQNHVYKSAINGELEPTVEKVPKSSCEGCDQSDGCS